MGAADGSDRETDLHAGSTLECESLGKKGGFINDFDESAGLGGWARRISPSGSSPLPA